MFLFWIEVHKIKHQQEFKAIYKNLITTVVFDIFDSVSLIGLVFSEDEKSQHLNDFVANLLIILACINFVLPSIQLFRLSKTHFNSHEFELTSNLMHQILKISTINIPFVCIRIYFWKVFGKEISIFLLKNSLAIFVGIKEIIHDIHSLRNCKNQNQNSEENQTSLSILRRNSNQ